MASRYFGDQAPKRPNILRGGGKSAELTDLRHDIETAFLRLQDEVDYEYWDDLKADVTQAKANLALAKDKYRDTDAQYYFFSHNVAEELTIGHQFKHGWVLGTQVRPHLHVIPMSAPASPQTVVVTGYYAWTDPNSTTRALPALTGWTTFRIEIAFGSSDQYKERIISMPLITPPSDVGASAGLEVFWKNATADGSYTYKTNKDHGTPQANILIRSIDAHFRRNRLGSLLEYGP